MVSGSNYTVTFTETGLAAGTNWSVQVCITPQCEDDDGALLQSSTSPTITFSLANGSYFFQVPEVNDTGATPDSGSFSVAGASPAPLTVHFGAPTLYAVTFTETGLAPGTNWSITLGEFGGNNQGDNGQGNQQGGNETNQTNGTNLTNQTNSSLGGSSQDSGDGGDGGAPGFNSSNTSTLTFYLPNGSYNYTVDNVTNYSIIGPANGSFNVSGASPPPIAVAFGVAPTFAVTFIETGLANGTNWTVSVHGTSHLGDQGDLGGAEDDASDVAGAQTSSTSSMAFMLMNGSYRFHVEEVDGYVASVLVGSFNVTGSALTINVTFTALPTYNVTFNESGLPSGTDWGLKIVGKTGHLLLGHPQHVRTSHAARGLVTFSLPTGKYHYKLLPLTGWKGTGGFPMKHFKVTGTALATHISFKSRSVAAPAVALTPVGGALPGSSLASGWLSALRADLAALRSI